MDAYTSKPTLLPTNVENFLLYRLREAMGICILGLAISLWVCLYSYDSADVSANTATAAPVIKNLYGAVGAYTADLLRQMFGLVSYILVLPLIAWGIFVIRHRPIFNLSRRLFIIGIVMILFAIGAGPKGGVCGQLALVPITRSLASMLGTWSGYLTQGVVSGLVIFFSTPLLAYAIGVTREDWWESIRKIAWLIHKIRSLKTSKVGAVQETIASSKPSKKSPRKSPTLTIPTTLEEGSLAALKTTIAASLQPVIETLRPASEHAKHSETALLELSIEDYQLPPLSLLEQPLASAQTSRLSHEAYEQRANLLKTVLDEFGIRGEIINVYPGPVVTLYEFTPAPGTKSSRVIGLADDIARSMSAISTRVAVIPGRNAIGIELPNEVRQTVYLRDLFQNEKYERSSAKLSLALGKDIGGEPIIADLARMPHLLVAGTTGSGKSVGINGMILSLIYRMSPERCKFIMIDPKMLELSVYDGIPHLLAPVVTDPKQAVVALKWTVREMESRYRSMSKLGVRNIEGYNQRLQEAKVSGEMLMRRVQTGFDPDTGKPIHENQPLELEPLPFIVVVVDEMADLMLVAGKDIEAAVQRLAQMARAAGIHLIMATQRPSVDVITGTIKANFPTRISFQVTSKIDSRTILGEMGAEQLLGQGDMLYMAAGGRITRIHGPFVRDEDVEKVVQFLKQQGEPDYIEAITEFAEDDSEGSSEGGGEGSGDALYDQAVALVCRERKASTSFIQRHLQIGYNRAARIMDRMEQEGVVSPANHVGKREIIGRSLEDY